MSIKAETIETIKMIKIINTTNATKTTMNESTTSSNWDENSDWDSDSSTKSRNDRESRIDESRNAKILFLFIFLTWDLRSNLSILLRKKAKVFVSRLNYRIIMFKKMLINK